MAKLTLHKVLEHLSPAVVKQKFIKRHMVIFFPSNVLFYVRLVRNLAAPLVPRRSEWLYKLITEDSVRYVCLNYVTIRGPQLLSINTTVSDFVNIMCPKEVVETKTVPNRTPISVTNGFAKIILK